MERRDLLQSFVINSIQIQISVGFSVIRMLRSHIRGIAKLWMDRPISIVLFKCDIFFGIFYVEFQNKRLYCRNFPYDTNKFKYEMKNLVFATHIFLFEEQILDKISNFSIFSFFQFFEFIFIFSRVYSPKPVFWTLFLR